MARVQVQDLPNPDRFRPAQPVGNTYTGAERPPIDQNAERLAQALASFSTAISSVAGRNKNAVGDDLVARYEQQRQVAGDAAAEGAVYDGRIPALQNPRAGPVVAGTIGQNHARAWTEQQRQQLNTGTYPLFDDQGRPTDIQAEHARRVQEHYGRQPAWFQLRPGVVNPNATAYQRGFSDEALKLRDEALAAQQRAVADQNNQLINGVIGRFMEPVIGAAQRAETTDDQLREIWAKQRQELRGWLTARGPDGNPRSLIDYRRMDDRMMGLLQNIAGQHPEAALRILRLDRGLSSEGAQLGSLGGNPQRDEASRAIMKAANDRLITLTDQRERERVVGGAVEALRRGDGSFGQIQPHSYDNQFDPGERRRIIPAEEIRRQAIERNEAESNQEIARQELTPEAAAERRWMRDTTHYIRNNVPHRGWREALNIYGRVLANPNELSNPEAADRAVAAMGLYERLMRENPGYTTETLGITPDARQFYDLARTYRDYRGQDPVTAMRSAAQAMHEPGARLDAEGRRALQQEARSLGDSTFAWLTGAATGARTVAEREITRVAETLMVGGMDPKAAVRAGARIVQERSAVVNGQPIYGNTFITKQNQDVVEQRLSQLQQEYAGRLNSEGGLYTGRLTLVPMPDRVSFQVVRADNRLPVIGYDQNGRPQMLRILGSEIQDLTRARDQAREQERMGRISEQADDTRDRAIVEQDRTRRAPPMDTMMGFPTGRDPADAGPVESPSPAARDAQRRVEQRYDSEDERVRDREQTLGPNRPRSRPLQPSPIPDPLRRGR